MICLSSWWKGFSYTWLEALLFQPISISLVFSPRAIVKSLVPSALQPLQSYQGCCYFCPKTTPLQTNRTGSLILFFQGNCSRPWPLHLFWAKCTPVCQGCSSTGSQNWTLNHSNKVFQLNNRYPIKWPATVLSTTITSSFNYSFSSYISMMQQKKAR